MLQKFQQFVRKESLLASGEKVLLAVSGGKDSMCMLSLFKERGYDFAIAHCNFQLRGEEAEGDEAFVRAAAEQSNVPFYTIRFDTKKHAAEHKVSIQMAARELRYAWFEEIATTNGYDRIAIAHHKNDVTESILINMIRGTGISGWIGPRAKFGRIIRPLMCFSAEEIGEYIRTQGIAFREDSSNKETKYLRNKIRHDLLPMLRELNPSIEDTLLGNSVRLMEAEQLQEAYLVSIKERLLRKEGQLQRISLMELKALPAIHTVLHYVLKEYHFSETDIENMIDCLKDRQIGKCFFSASHQVVVDRADLLISAVEPSKAGQKEFNKNDKQLQFGRYLFELSVCNRTDTVVSSASDQAFIDADELPDSLSIRLWQPGDKFYPLGMQQQKKLSDLLIDNKVSILEKQTLPVILSGEKIVWVVGQRIDNRFRVTASTNKVLHISIVNHG